MEYCMTKGQIIKVAVRKNFANEVYNKNNYYIAKIKSLQCKIFFKKKYNMLRFWKLISAVLNSLF